MCKKEFPDSGGGSGQQLICSVILEDFCLTQDPGSVTKYDCIFWGLLWSSTFGDRRSTSMWEEDKALIPVDLVPGPCLSRPGCPRLYLLFQQLQVLWALQDERQSG